MKILVTGGAGFIGSHVVDLYLEHGYEVVIVDNLETGRLSNVNPGAAFYQMDIRSPQLREVFVKERPDVVNHHAAQMDVRRSVADPEYDCEVNIRGTLNLIESARLVNVKRFIYISSGGAVYGEPEYLPCDESHPINPICQYGASKHTVEHYLYLYNKNYGMRYCVLRYPNVYGPRQDPGGEAGVVAIFLGQMLEGKPVTINGDGEQQRDFVYVGDCASANLLVLERPDAHGIYNLGSGQGTSINEIFNHLRVITGFTGPPNYGPAKLGETRRIYLDASRAQRQLGWTSNYSLQEGLKKTMEYFQRTEKLQRAIIQRYEGDLSPSTIPTAIIGEVERTAARGVRSDARPEINRDERTPILDRINRLHSSVEEMTQRNSSTFSPREILRLAVGAAGATSGSIFLVDEGRTITQSVISYNGDTRPTNPQQFSDTLEQGLAGWVATHRQATLVDDTTNDSRWLRRPWEEENSTSRSAICVPVMDKGKVAGVLTLLHKGKGSFSRDDLALLATMAATVSVHNMQGSQL
jgi:UDP-glucose 4-epimerase